MTSTTAMDEIYFKHARHLLEAQVGHDLSWNLSGTVSMDAAISAIVAALRERDEWVDAQYAAVSELEASPESQDTLDRRFTEMLLDIINDVQDELGFDDEDKESANGSIEIVSAIRELKQAVPEDVLPLLERALPFLRDEADKYEDDGSNEPLELARESVIDGRLYTTRQIAERLGVHYDTARERIKRAQHPLTWAALEGGRNGSG
ncbi:hypothetical protein [[Pseudomonas] boreopolis]|uniref:Uncharacterized protein n=1 Tax=Xanthomonas boreopolis TaxID=86183 RepID=A0A919KI87_9XANT|nr:hypothetical protein GCM10009090_16120 [[Pseudomonas] boreopolis]